MVQAVLIRYRVTTVWTKFCLCLALVLSLWTSAYASKVKIEKDEPPPPPDLLLEGGRKLSFERIFDTDRDVAPKRGFFTKVLDVVIGAPDRHRMIRPYGVAINSHGTAMVTDPGAMGVHIFDFAQHKYKFITRRDKDENSLHSPQCVAVDGEDNFYVTDSETGRIFVFDANGKFKRNIGSLRGGEGYFKRPTGIAVDSAAQRIYISDTLRNQVFVLDMQGQVMQTIGQTGTEPGEFNFPTEIVLHGHDVAVVDAMNFRVQVFDRSGGFEYAVGSIGDGVGSFFRPKGISFDSEGHLYVVDGAWNTVQVFDRLGDLLYYFGMEGSEPGAFSLPSGLFIDRNDTVYIVDSYNSRVQVFHYYGKRLEGGGQ
ncbi:MAG TPA: 6-bladed beta-propeller [Terriglobales bacterium]|nr:6-bladed beta-propeller [Terriglobales bacterium]